MLLRAGLVSLALLLASRVLGLLRESALAAAFGTSGMADVAVLMLTLPDWLAGVLASGALAYVLLPAWAGQPAAVVDAVQRRVARGLLGLSLALALGLVLALDEVLQALLPSLQEGLQSSAGQALLWSAAALPLAFLAALWATRLQHDGDFAGLYGANLVVNGVLVVVLAALAWLVPTTASGRTGMLLGAGLMAALGGRLAWLLRRQRRTAAAATGAGAASTAGEAAGIGNAVSAAALPKLPAPSAWVWATLAAGLPLALPFAARSAASQGGEGALATFNYAWKLVELPLLLAVQLVAALAFPAISRALKGGEPGAHAAIRQAFALAWTVACAAAVALLVAAPALAQLLFGWGRMDPAALARVADWGRSGAWSLPPHALVAVAVTVLASQARMRWAVLAYALGLGGLALAIAGGVGDGAALMHCLVAISAGVAVVVLLALGPALASWLPATALAAPALALAAGGWGLAPWAAGLGTGAQLATGVLAALATLGAGLASADVRVALRRRR